MTCWKWLTRRVVREGRGGGGGHVVNVLLSTCADFSLQDYRDPCYEKSFSHEYLSMRKMFDAMDGDGDGLGVSEEAPAQGHPPRPRWRRPMPPCCPRTCSHNSSRPSALGSSKLKRPCQAQGVAT